MDLTFKPLGHKARPLREWLTTFHLVSVVLDPYTNESSWVLPPAERILHEFSAADVRVSFIVAADEADTKRFVGPLAEQFLVFSDPNREIVKALDVAELPAFVFIRVDGEVVAKAEGWVPAGWRTVAEAISEATHWEIPDIPEPQDPGAFAGSPALG